MTDPAREPGLTWRDPVLWLVVGPPLAAVLGGLATVWIAMSHRDPLVTDTVQKVGVTWQDAATAPAAGDPTASIPAASASTGGAATPTSAAPTGAAPRADDPSDDDGG